MAQQENKRVILIPVDDTEASQHSLDWALENMFRPGDEFYFLHVVDKIQPSSSLLAGLVGVNSALMIGHNDEEQQEHRLQEAKDMLRHKYVAKAKAAGAQQRIEVVQFSASTESVGQVVTTRAKELKATAVVIATHNRSSLAEFFVGTLPKALSSKGGYCNLEGDHRPSL